jgi:hypothetical protein
MALLNSLISRSTPDFQEFKEKLELSHYFCDQLSDWDYLGQYFDVHVNFLDNGGKEELKQKMKHLYFIEKTYEGLKETFDDFDPSFHLIPNHKVFDSQRQGDDK